MPRVTGLGHVWIYVRDLERMVAFYRDVMGMRITKQNWRVGIVFLSADPDAVDHEIALMRGRPDATDPHLIQQISMRVASLDDLRAFHRRPGRRRLPHRGGCQPRQRHRLLLL